MLNPFYKLRTMSVIDDYPARIYTPEWFVNQIRVMRALILEGGERVFSVNDIRGHLEAEFATEVLMLLVDCSVLAMEDGRFRLIDGALLAAMEADHLTGRRFLESKAGRRLAAELLSFLSAPQIEPTIPAIYKALAPEQYGRVACIVAQHQEDLERGTFELKTLFDDWDPLGKVLCALESKELVWVADDLVIPYPEKEGEIAAIIREAGLEDPRGKG